MIRKFRFSIMVIIVLSISLLIASSGFAAPNPFIGKWYNTDPFDGSQQRMTVGGGRDRHHITYFDSGASICKLYPAKILGWGIIEGNTMTADVDIWCQTGPEKGYWGPWTLEFVYNPGTDTLAGSGGEVWNR